MTRFHSSNRSGTSATDGTPVAAAVAGEHQSGDLDLSDLAAPAARQRTGNGDSTPLALFEDVAAVTAVGNKEAILDELVELQKRCQIRDKTRPGRGLWYVDSKEELQQILSVKEAERLVLRHGPTGRIMGALIYQTQFSELGDFDAPLKVFLDGWQKRIPTLDVLLRDRKVGLIHAVFIDDGVFQEVGIPRGLACQYMQAYAVHEGLAQGVKRFVAIVRAGARANTALPFLKRAVGCSPSCPHLLRLIQLTAER